MPVSPIEQLSINTIRTLAMDAVEAAKSGHPGTPMSLAPLAYLLFSEVLRYDPADPNWSGRDRFVLSAGHASMLLYAALHLAGISEVDDDGKPTGRPAVSLDDIRNFRQIGSRTPGHPEIGHTAGVETTTGPLGQGLGNSVGLAIASRWLGANFNRPGFELFNYNVYAVCSDGDLMEGISHEAASIAGHLGLGNLCWFYDDNHITIEGNTALAFSEDVARRFEAYGWNVLHVADANDLSALRGAVEKFQATTDQPTIVIVKSRIAWGAPKAENTAEAHGAPLGEAEIRATKKVYGWPEDSQFRVPDEVVEHFRQGPRARGAKLHAAWKTKFEQYSQEHPDLAEYHRLMRRRELPAGWDKDIPVFPADPKGVASRVSSGKVLNQVAKNLPWLVGGSADLAPSTRTLLDGIESFGAGVPTGRNFHFGIREHAMAATVNGMTLAGLKAYGATFFVFSDYLRPSLRLSAIMRLPALYIFTHDSIGVGEDGPTHQPVEHLAAPCAIPNLIVMRPGDANEVAEAYRTAIALRTGPAALILTRQNIPTLDRREFASAAGVALGAYVLADALKGQPEVILIGTGSELSLAVDAWRRLVADGVKARVVSMPSWELFTQQSPEYQEAVLPRAVTARVAVEAGARFGWDQWIGRCGRFVGMTGYGASGPAGKLYQHFGITVDRVVDEARQALKR